MHFLHSQRPCPNGAQACGVKSIILSNEFTSVTLTSAEQVARAVAVEVVALTVLATVDFCRILPLLTFAGATEALAIVATDICTVGFSAVSIQVV